MSLPEFALAHTDHVTATYVVRSTPEKIQCRARAISSEESTGSWVTLPEETSDIRDQFGARVARIRRLAHDLYVVKLDFPADDFGANVPLLLAYLFGGISALSDVRLVDVQFPSRLFQQSGPRFGISGLRVLTRRSSGPLLMGIIKPCIGLRPQEHAQIAAAMAAGGADIVKDDELLVDPPIAPLRARCRAVAQALRALRRTSRTLYFASVTAPPSAALRFAKDAKECGADGVLVSGFVTGVSVVTEIAAALHIPVALHPAMAGAFYQAPGAGIDERVLFGRLPRIIGADITIFFGPYGKYRLPDKSVQRIVSALTKQSPGLRSSFPAIAAGVHPGQVHRLIAAYGTDIIIAAGGSIVAHPLGPKAGALAFRQAIDAALDGVSLATACNRYVELRTAIETWSDPTGKDPTYDVSGSDDPTL